MSRPTLPGIAAIFDVDRPVLGNRRRYGHIEDELRALIPGCDPTGSLRLLSDPIFRQFKLEEQVHAFVKTFVQQVYGELPGRHVESARNYVVRPEFLICLNLPAPGSNASKSLGLSEMTRCRIAVPCFHHEVNQVKLQNAKPSHSAATVGWGIGLLIQHHALFSGQAQGRLMPGPTLLPDSSGNWTPGGRAFRDGNMAAEGESYQINAVTAHHPHFRQIRHPGRASSAFVAGGARAVSWRLIDRDAYLTPDPVNLPSMHWYLDFDFEIPGDQQRRVVKWYFEIVFTKGLQELQDEVVDRERMAAYASAQSAGRLNEMGRGEESASRRMGRMAAYWPEARQGEQW